MDKSYRLQRENAIYESGYVPLIDPPPFHPYVTLCPLCEDYEMVFKGGFFADQLDRVNIMQILGYIDDLQDLASLFLVSTKFHHAMLRNLGALVSDRQPKKTRFSEETLNKLSILKEVVNPSKGVQKDKKELLPSTINYLEKSKKKLQNVLALKSVTKKKGKQLSLKKGKSHKDTSKEKDDKKESLTAIAKKLVGRIDHHHG
eukprot:TRINITY_DN2328_c0_g1_i1.p1 TRINITY_DN2328_c0_g1~~TRINITY_DN2328_c0_g1_i1.p1  ORF type:complete len:202 (-),score=43.18 TRINITY_DN2328_c0_g1_i1:36-641(-)